METGNSTHFPPGNDAQWVRSPKNEGSNAKRLSFHLMFAMMFGSQQEMARFVLIESGESSQMLSPRRS
jgi:hypothetical protein